jgi:hypothetical protein
VARFTKVLKFHPPGLAAASDVTGSYHINLDGTPAYAARFAETFGFYEGLAAARDAAGWFHIRTSGEAVYPHRYNWCGNYQGGRVPVCNAAGRYFHLDPAGRRAYREDYLYAGDYRDGVACVRREDGLCIHINLQGRPVHSAVYQDLDVFHKGLARARDARGWFHIHRDGCPAYDARFAEVEPFYNGQAFCRDWTGRRVLVSESGKIAHVVWDADLTGTLPSKQNAQPIIVVAGNCGSGKSTLAPALANAMQLPLLGIDESRRAVSDGSPVGEARAYLHFLEAIRHSCSTGAVVEFSGSGQLAHLVKLVLAETGNYAVIWLRASVETCRVRVAGRPLDVPYPRFGIAVENLIPELHARLEREFARGEIWPSDYVHAVNGEAAPNMVLAEVAGILKAKGVL